MARNKTMVSDNVIIDSYLSGLSQRDVAKTFNIGQTTVKNILKRNGIRARQTRVSKKIEDEIVKRYGWDENSEFLAKEYNLHSTTICRILNRNGVKILPATENKKIYNIIDNFFETIDSEEKAYILGMLYADGNVNKKTNTVKLELQKRDIDILEKILKIICPEGTLPKIGTDREYKYITINREKIKQDLISHGCVPKKTFVITVPNIDEDLMPHFLRGYLDGDGCINISKDNVVRVIFSGQEKFLSQIKKYLNSVNIISTYQEASHRTGGDLTVKRKADASLMLDILYKGSNIYLNRKYAKYLDAKRVLEGIAVPENYGKAYMSYKGNKVTKNYVYSLSINEREDLAKQALKYFRFSGFPYPKYTKKELSRDFQNLIRYEPYFNGKEIKSQGRAGQYIFKHYCPHYYSVSSKNRPGLLESFNDDDKLLSVIRNRLGITYKEVYQITGDMIIQGLKASRIAFYASVFKPSVAKLFYDHFAPINAKVLDISAGFGQRMMGAAASNKVIHYTGLDPWKQTIEALQKMHDNEFPNFDVNLINIGSEKFESDEKYDLCFSSPPFYNKEIYAYDDTQAAHRKSMYEFISEWWVPTAQNVHGVLNKGSYFILNMDKDIIKDMIKASSDLFYLHDEYYIVNRRAHMNKDSKDHFYILKAK